MKVIVSCFLSIRFKSHATLRKNEKKKGREEGKKKEEGNNDRR